MAQHDPVSSPSASAVPEPRNYVLDEQIGFLLRQVNQRHTAIFANNIGDEITPTQWAAVSKLAEKGPCSQNLLGRLTAMDVATIKGVVDRLTKRGLTETRPDPTDGRRLLVVLTEEGETLAKALSANAFGISDATLEPLTPKERAQLVMLLQKLT